MTVIMSLGHAWCYFLLFTLCSAEKWRFPERTSSTVRLDSKVRFSDSPSTDNVNILSTRESFEKNAQSDELPFREPTETQGFYNRPPGVGRYPVRVEINEGISRLKNKYASYLKPKPVYESDGTLDSLQVCKCSASRACGQNIDYSRVCGDNMHLCCYKEYKQRPSEYFNEMVDERPMLLPGRAPSAGPFPAPPDTLLTGQFGPGHAHEAALLAAIGSSNSRVPGILVGPQGPQSYFNQAQRPENFNSNRPVLVGPDGPTGILGPNNNVLVGPNGPTGTVGPSEKPVFVGPGGPTGTYGPTRKPFVSESDYSSSQRPILVGPDGPTGVIGPSNTPSVLVGPEGPTGTIGPDKKPVLVGPEGPTGIIGPNNNNGHESYKNGQDVRPSETAQRPVLVGPGGPTGIIGPAYNQRPILVGPGGPTGIIGPGRPVLVGPRGPTGVIGPNYGRPRRPILVGPGGPTGVIGPYGLYGK